MSELKVAVIVPRLFQACEAFLARCFLGSASARESDNRTPVLRPRDELAAIILTDKAGESFLESLWNLSEILKASLRSNSKAQSTTGLSSALSAVRAEDIPLGAMERFVRCCEDTLSVFADFALSLRAPLQRAINPALLVFAERSVDDVLGVFYSHCEPQALEQFRARFAPHDAAIVTRRELISRCVKHHQIFPLTTEDGLLYACMRHPQLFRFPYVVNTVLRCFAAATAVFAFQYDGDCFAENAIPELLEQSDTIAEFLDALHHRLFVRTTHADATESEKGAGERWEFDCVERLHASFVVALTAFSLSNQRFLNRCARSLLHSLLHIEAVKKRKLGAEDEEREILARKDRAFHEVNSGGVLSSPQRFATIFAPTVLSRASNNGTYNSSDKNRGAVPVIPMTGLQAVVEGATMLFNEVGSMVASLRSQGAPSPISQSREMLFFLEDLLSLVLRMQREIHELPFSLARDSLKKEFTTLRTSVIAFLEAALYVDVESVSPDLLSLLEECAQLDGMREICAKWRSAHADSVVVVAASTSSSARGSVQGKKPRENETMEVIDMTDDAETPTQFQQPPIVPYNKIQSESERERERENEKEKERERERRAAEEQKSLWSFLKHTSGVTDAVQQKDSLSSSIMNSNLNSSTAPRIGNIKKRVLPGSFLDRLAQQEQDVYAQQADGVNKRYKINTNSLAAAAVADQRQSKNIDVTRQVAAEQRAKLEALIKEKEKEKAKTAPATDNNSNNYATKIGINGSSKMSTDEDANEEKEIPLVPRASFLKSTLFGEDDNDDTHRNSTDKTRTVMSEEEKLKEMERQLERMRELQKERVINEAITGATHNEGAHIAQALLSVSADEIVADILSLKMSEMMREAEETNTSSSLSAKTTNAMPVKFSKEEAYITAFQPLLVDEFKASLRQLLLQSDPLGVSSSLRDKDRDKDKLFRQKNGGDPDQWELNVLDMICDALPLALPQASHGSDDKGRNSNSSGGNESALKRVPFREANEESDYSRDLAKDDLVLMFRPQKNASNTLRRRDLRDLKHIFGLVAQTPRQSSRALRGTSVRSANDTYTVIMKGSQNPKPECALCFVPVMNLSTFLREWTALLSIKNKALFPLAPYLLFASPSVSSQLLSSINDAITKAINAIEVNSSSSNSKALIQLEKKLLSELRRLDELKINGTVLRTVKIVAILQQLSKNKEQKYPQACVAHARSLVEKWKAIVKEQETAAATQCKGGNVACIPSSKNDVPKPEHLSTVLWEKLQTNYNVSQLFAIKYVAEKFDSQQDTRIALIQGPPGTGKTSTIIGLISTLLSKPVTAKNSDSAATAEDSTTKIATSSSITTTAITPVQRVLICAPSNAAIDEVLTRLHNGGVFDDKEASFVRGIDPLKQERRAVRIVRLGEGLESASDTIKSLSLEAQVEKRLRESALFISATTLFQDFEALKVAQEDFLRDNPELRSYENRAAMYRQRERKQQDDNNITESRSDKAIDSKLKKYKQFESDLRALRHDKFRYETEIEKLRGELRAEVLAQAEVVGATLSASGRTQFCEMIAAQQLSFPTVIVDEAGQTTEPSTLLPLRFGCRKLILVGDPRQLPPTVLSRRAEQAGLSRSLFERLERAEHEVVMLSVQYRMHPEIRLFPSQHFYNNLLEDSQAIKDEIEGRSPSGLVTSPLIAALRLPPVAFFDSGRLRPEITERSAGTSFVNDYEAAQIVRFLEQALSVLGDELSIAVITPYKAQVRRVLDACQRSAQIAQAMRARTTEKNRIEVNTVDGFQGREKDVVIFSCVRCNANASSRYNSNNNSSGSGYGGKSRGAALAAIGFVADERRLNVAVTRAKKSLVVFGHCDTLKEDAMWRAMIDSFAARNTLFDKPFSLSSSSKQR